MQALSSSAGKPPFFSQAPAARARGAGKPGCAAAKDSSGPGCVAAAANESSSHHYHSRALAIEDVRTARAELRARGYM
eukprot:5900954-Pyramimonas_sp.AAC.1